MFLSDDRLRRIGWGSMVVVVTLMCSAYNSVSPPPERCTFPDSEFVKTDMMIRVIGGCGAIVAVLAAAVRFISRRSRFLVT